MNIGETATVSKTISEYDVYGFAGIVGDFNTIHIDAVAAKASIFGRRIAHGLLVGSLFSAVLGTKLPGPGTIELEQHLKFNKPVYLGDTISATVTLSEVLNNKKGIYKLITKATNQHNECVIDGWVVVLFR